MAQKKNTTREWRITWNRPGGRKQVVLRQTEKGARDLFERRSTEGTGSDCLIPSYDPANPGASCVDRDHDDPCVICAEQFAENVTIQVRTVQSWAAFPVPTFKPDGTGFRCLFCGTDADITITGGGKIAGTPSLPEGGWCEGEVSCPSCGAREYYSDSGP
jgi:hypothetical protein